MSFRQHPIPEAVDVPDSEMVPSAVPVDESGRELIPELSGREPTHNEREIISGEPIAMASSNVGEIWWNWQNRKLFVRFLDGSLYHYDDVPLAVVVGFVETASPGRYVWNVLRDKYGYGRLVKGNKQRPKAQVVRLVNR